MLGIEDKWVAPASLLCNAVPLSLLAVAVGSFTRKLDEARLSFCFSSNMKNNEDKVQITPSTTQP
jgi:hypothetical protein